MPVRLCRRHRFRLQFPSEEAVGVSVRMSRAPRLGQGSWAEGGPPRPLFLVLTPPPRAAAAEVKDEVSRGAADSSLPVRSSSSLSSSSSAAARAASAHSLADYAQRVLWLFQGPDARNNFTDVQQDSIAAVAPTAEQAALRRHVVGGFALQQLAVCLLVGVGSLVSAVKDPLSDVFDAQHATGALLTVAAAQVLVVLVLWFVDDPWPLLVLFSLLHALFVAGLALAFDSNLPFLNCFAACWGLCALTLLVGVARRSKTVDSSTSQPLDSSSVPSSSSSSSVPPLPLDEVPCRFLPWPATALGAFLWIAIPSIAGVAADPSIMSWRGLAASLSFQLVLMFWFAWHATVILFRALAPSEASFGVLHLNVDAPTAFIVGCVTAVASLIAVCRSRRYRTSSDSI